MTEFEFKDGKLRIIPTAIQYYSTSTYNISEKEWSPVNLDTGFGVYNKKGKVRGMFSTYVESIENLANNPIASLKSYIEKGKDDSANSDW